MEMKLILQITWQKRSGDLDNGLPAKKINIKSLMTKKAYLQTQKGKYEAHKMFSVSATKL